MAEGVQVTVTDAAPVEPPGLTVTPVGALNVWVATPVAASLARPSANDVPLPTAVTVTQ